MVKSEGWLQQNQKLIIGFFYNENGVKRRGHLPKTKKKSGGCSTLVKKVK
jgi:hypothetical protein